MRPDRRSVSHAVCSIRPRPGARKAARARGGTWRARLKPAVWSPKGPKSASRQKSPPAPARLAGDTSGRLRHFPWVVCTYEHATDNRSLKYGQKPSTSHQLCTMRAPPSTGVVDKKVTFFTRLYTQKKDYTYIVCDLLAAVLDGGTSSGYADNVGEAAER